MFDVDTFEAISELFRCFARSAWLMSLAFDDAADFFSIGVDVQTSGG
ncbi:hypothetical protein [Paraburkholderia tuberum]|uniref:Uncharacterized protein n=1 Tax=Paraburkholderia tuberum TaxID=157910 RepID=A0A1H1JB32_9BURK|nr:hypothetical protein [Paraburkholderia tuberum]SDR47192.1 hypothetical protein SAMN05445850_4520 [Paraburkholderia tuberum]